MLDMSPLRESLESDLRNMLIVRCPNLEKINKFRHILLDGENFSNGFHGISELYSQKEMKLSQLNNKRLKSFRIAKDDVRSTHPIGSHILSGKFTG